MSIEINKQTQFDLDDIDLILSLLPKSLREYLNSDQRKYDLTEIVLDLGRKPIIRFMEESIYLDQQSRVTEKDIKQLYKYPSSRICKTVHGHFGDYVLKKPRKFPLSRPFRILFFGRILEYKGLPIIIEAFS